MFDYIKDRFNEKSTFLGLISLAASGIMLVTPDSVDQIIEVLLFAFGLGSIVKKDAPVVKEEKKVVKKK